MDSSVWKSLKPMLKAALATQTQFMKTLKSSGILLVSHVDGMSSFIEVIKHPTANSLTLSVGWAKHGYDLEDIGTERISAKSAMKEPAASVRIGSVLGHKCDYWWNLSTESEQQSLLKKMFSEAGLYVDLPFPGTAIDESSAINDICDKVNSVVIPFLKQIAAMD